MPARIDSLRDRLRAAVPGAIKARDRRAADLITEADTLATYLS